MPPDSKNPTGRLGRENFVPRPFISSLGPAPAPHPALALPIVLNEIKQTGSGALAAPDGHAGGGPEDSESRGLQEERLSLHSPLETGPGPGQAGGGVQPPHPHWELIVTVCQGLMSSLSHRLPRREKGGESPARRNFASASDPVFGSHCSRSFLSPRSQKQGPSGRRGRAGRTSLGAKPCSKPSGMGGARMPQFYCCGQKDSVLQSESRR